MIGVNPQIVVGIGGDHELPPPQAKQIVLPHDAGHPLVVDRPSAPFQFGGDSPPAITGKLQRNPLDRVPQVYIFVGSFLLRLPPVKSGSADLTQLAHPQHRHRDAFLDLVLDVLCGRGLPVSACSIRCSSIRCKHPFKKSISSACCPTLRSS